MNKIAESYRLAARAYEVLRNCTNSLFATEGDTLDISVALRDPVASIILPAWFDITYDIVENMYDLTKGTDLEPRGFFTVIAGAKDVDGYDLADVYGPKVMGIELLNTSEKYLEYARNDEKDEPTMACIENIIVDLYSMFYGSVGRNVSEDDGATTIPTVTQRYRHVTMTETKDELIKAGVIDEETANARIEENGTPDNPFLLTDCARFIVGQAVATHTMEGVGMLPPDKIVVTRRGEANDYLDQVENLRLVYQGLVYNFDDVREALEHGSRVDGYTLQALSDALIDEPIVATMFTKMKPTCDEVVYLATHMPYTRAVPLVLEYALSYCFDDINHEEAALKNVTRLLPILHHTVTVAGDEPGYLIMSGYYTDMETSAGIIGGISREATSGNPPSEHAINLLKSIDPMFVPAISSVAIRLFIQKYTDISESGAGQLYELINQVIETCSAIISGEVEPSEVYNVGFGVDGDNGDSDDDYNDGYGGGVF